MEQTIICSLCGAKIEEWKSNNAEPLNDGRCCHDCNVKYVMVARAEAMEKAEG